MSIFGKAKGGGRRKALRETAPVLATLSTVGNDFRVGIINLSNTGALVTAPDLPSEGEHVIFRADKVQSFGTVAWTNGGQCGVAFEGSLADSEVERLRQDGSMWGAAMSPEQRAAAAEWELGCGR
jgi:hypothetical protein